MEHCFEKYIAKQEVLMIDGDVAQLVERSFRIRKVPGSIPGVSMLGSFFLNFLIFIAGTYIL